MKRIPSRRQSCRGCVEGTVSKRRNGMDAEPSSRRLSTIAFCCFPCFLFPYGIHFIGQTFAEAGLRDPSSYSPWPLHAVDALFLVDVLFTPILIWKMRGWE